MKKEIAKRRKNNKGFSLVELIIVIAIMAILVGILAPQFIKYVERSRVSTDTKNVQEIVSAVQVYAADSENTLLIQTAVGSENTITLTTGDDIAIAGTSATQLGAALTDAGIKLTTNLRSTNWPAAGIVITISVNGEGSPTFTYNATGLE